MGVIRPVSTTSAITHMGFCGLSLSAGGLGYVLRRQRPWGRHLEPQGRARRINYHQQILEEQRVEQPAAKAATG